MEDRLPISVCYMVKNEEQFLEAALNSSLQWAGEILISDTGSTDRSLEIIRTFSDRYSHIQSFPLEWENHFAISRNKMIEKCRFEWVFFIDGDEVFDSQCLAELKDCVSQSGVGCFSIIQRNYTSNLQLSKLTHHPSRNLPGLTEAWPEELYYFDNFMERLLNKSLSLQFEGRLHESLMPSCRANNIKHQKSSVLLHHYGRLKTSQEKKLRYYQELATKKIKEEPFNPASWVEIIQITSELGDPQRAFEYAKLAFSKFKNEKLVEELMIQTALRVNEFSLAESLITQAQQRRSNPKLYQEELALSFLYQKKFSECSETSLDILNNNNDNFIAHLCLGTIAYEKEDWRVASKHIHAAALERPNDSFIQSAIKKLASKNEKH